MDPRGSFHTYPRVDKIYQSRGSLNFDIVRTKIFKNWGEPINRELMVCCIYALIGVCTGLICTFITGAEDEFAKLKARITSDIIRGYEDEGHERGYMLEGWLFFTLFSTGFGLLSAILVAYKAPQAAGSGTP